MNHGDCDTAGGVYFGDGVDCGDIDCFDDPQAGACCLPNGLCSFTTQDQCNLKRGQFSRIGLTCDDVSCIPIGACCMYDGSCQMLSLGECLRFGYQYNGDGSLCSQTNCVAPIGRCCIPFDVCMDTTVDDCFSIHGGFVWSIPDDCTNTCPHSGACCLNGFCFIQSQEICEVWLGGTYHGDNVVCDPYTCDNCPADIAPQPSGNGVVNVADLLMVINNWGPCSPPPAHCPADIAPPGGNGNVNVGDLLLIISSWGPCP